MFRIHTATVDAQIQVILILGTDLGDPIILSNRLFAIYTRLRDGLHVTLERVIYAGIVIVNLTDTRLLHCHDENIALRLVKQDI